MDHAVVHEAIALRKDDQASAEIQSQIKVSISSLFEVRNPTLRIIVARFRDGHSNVFSRKDRSMSRRHTVAAVLVAIAFLLSAKELRPTVAILSANDPPVAVDDNYTVHGQLLLTPASNDYNPEGDRRNF